MPVKIVHWRYVVLDVNENHNSKKLLELFKKVFGHQLYSLSGLRLVERGRNIAIYAISSKYVSQLIAVTVLYGETYNERIVLRGIANTLRSVKRYLLNN